MSSRPGSPSTGRPHVVIAITNVPVDRDRRVCREARALVDAGATVTVICPRDSGAVPSVPDMPTVRTVSFRRYHQGSTAAGFAFEFAWAFVCIAWCLLRAARNGRLSAVQFCNPPDVFMPLMVLLRMLGCRAVFDHHDLSPEIYLSRADNAASNAAVLRVLTLLERLSVRAANGVVATNSSFRDLEVSRAGGSLDRIVVARNGPWLDEVPRVNATPPARPRIVYLGVIGKQDGVDAFIAMSADLAVKRDDVDFVVIGDGEELPALRRLASSLGVEKRIRFTGWLSPREVGRELELATIAVQPDPRSPMNEISTMAKTVEYLAYGIPVVAVDLCETRRTAGDAAVYVTDSSAHEFSQAVAQLLDDPQRRAELGARGRARVVDELAWDHQSRAYVDLYRRWFPQLLPPKAPAG